jgi:hypothetical protein
MRSEAVSKNRPAADLINIALEKVVEVGLELPGFTTLDALAAKVRTEVSCATSRTPHWAGGSPRPTTCSGSCGYRLPDALTKCDSGIGDRLVRRTPIPVRSGR